MSDVSIPSILGPLLEQRGPSSSATSDYQPFLTFQLRSGTEFSNRYEHLLWVVLKMEGELVLRYSSHTVRLKGRNLGVLQEEIKSLKSRSVLELDERYDVEENDGPVVTSIWVGKATEEDIEELTGPRS